jgi:hypothetical protein
LRGHFLLRPQRQPGTQNQTGEFKKWLKRKPALCRCRNSAARDNCDLIRRESTNRRARPRHVHGFWPIEIVLGRDRDLARLLKVFDHAVCLFGDWSVLQPLVVRGAADGRAERPVRFKVGIPADFVQLRCSQLRGVGSPDDVVHKVREPVVLHGIALVAKFPLLLGRCGKYSDSVDLILPGHVGSRCSRGCAWCCRMTWHKQRRRSASS